MDYFSRPTIDRESLLKDRNFLSDARSFLKNRTGKEYQDDEDLFNAFIEHMRIGTISEVTAIRDRNYIKKANQKEKNRAGKLYITFDRIRKPTSMARLLGDYGEGILRSPSSYISLTGVGVIGKGAAFGKSLAYNQITKQLATDAISKSAKKAALRGAGIEGGIGALQGAAHTAARQETGRGEYRDTSMMGGALLGAAVGAIPGAGIGAFAGAKAVKQEMKALKLYEEGQATIKLRLADGKIEADKILNTESGKKVKAALGNTFKPLTQEEIEEFYKRKGKGYHPLPEDRKREGYKILDLPESMEWRRSMKPEVLHNVEAGMVQLIIRMYAGMGKNIPFTEMKGKRITEIMSDAVRQRTELMAKDVGAEKADKATQSFLRTQMDKVVLLEKKLGLTPEQFSSVLVAQASEYGRGLQFFGRVKGLFTKARIKLDADEKSQKETLNKFKNETDVMNSLGLKGAGQGEELADMYHVLHNPNQAWIFFKNLDKARRAFMTVQTATTMRNTLGGTFRSAMFLLDNMFHGTLDLATAGSDTFLRKQALARMGSGFRLFHSLTWNQAEANVLRLLFSENMPLTFRSVYRQNADIAVEIGKGSGIATFGRKINILNTYADNAFKRAAFFAELSTQVGGTKELRKLIQEGRFSELATKKHKGALEKSIIVAKSLVYQRGWREKEFVPATKKVDDEAIKTGFFKRFFGKAEEGPAELGKFELSSGSQMTAWFLKASDNPIATAIVPFPRFVMNSLDFVFSHAPLFGMIGVSGRKWKENLAKQMSGGLLLYGAIQLRAAQGPEARWWEIYDKEAKQFYSALPLYGPFAPYMLAAHIITASRIHRTPIEDAPTAPLYATTPIKDAPTAPGKWGLYDPLIAGPEEYRKEIEKRWARTAHDPLMVAMFNDETFKQGLKATFGTTFRTGMAYDMLSALNEDSQEMYDQAIEGRVFPAGVSNVVSRTLGKYGATYFVPGGEFNDLFSLWNPDFEKKHDINAVVTNSLDIFIANTLRSLPIDDQGRYLALVKGPKGIELIQSSPTQREELRREGRDVTQLTGLGAMEREKTVERELIRLNIPKYTVFETFRLEPKLKRKANVLYQEYVAKYIRPYMESSQYKSMPNTVEGALQQKKNLRILFAKMRSEVNDILAEQLSYDYNQIGRRSPERAIELEGQLYYLYKKTYNRISKDKQRLALLTFKKQNKGKGPARSGAEALRDLTILINLARSL